MTNNNKWVKERSHEAYAKNYALVFPRDEPLAGRNMRKDPFHQVLLDAGCVYQEKHGWERPSWFDLSGSGTEVRVATQNLLNFNYVSLIKILY